MFKLDFVLITTQRSGSHMLMDLLNSHPQVKAYGEIAPSDSRRSIEPTPVLGKKIGAIVHYNQWERAKANIDLSVTKVVHLKRNPENVAMSVVRNEIDARTRGDQHKANYKAGEQRPYFGAIDPEKVERRSEKVNRLQVQFTEFLADHDVFTITYEELTAGVEISEAPESVMRSMLAFLRIPCETPLRTNFLKIAPPRRRYVIYTCLFGDYDDLPPAPEMLGPASAVCFTDNLDREPNGWLLRSLPAGDQLDPIRASRFAKILPHRVLLEHDASLYIDCNVRLKRDVSELFDLGHLWVVPKHPQRECIFFEESKRLLEKRKIDDPRQLLDQLRRYRLAGMPEYFGLTENRFIVRQHHHETVKEFGEAWWQEYLNGCPRDQISFPFVAWKTTLPHLKLEPAFCKRAFKRVPHLHWVSPADAQPTRDPAPSPPRRNAFHRPTQLVNLDQLRIGIVTHRDYGRNYEKPGSHPLKKKKNSGSSRLRGDWLIKYWPQAELFKPRTIYDVLIFQKVAWVEQVELFFGITVYDACDPKENWLTMAQLCDLVTASSQALTRELGNALFIPDRFDLDYFTLQKVHEARPTEAVWFGYRDNIEPLMPFLEPLNKLGIRLKTITDKPTEVGDVNLCFPNSPDNPDYSVLNYELIQSDIVLNPPLHKFKSENKTHHAWLLNLPVAKTPEEVETFLEPYSRNVEVDRGALDIRLSVREFKSLLTTFIREHNITGPKLIYSRMRTKVKYAENVGRTSVSKVSQRIRREIVYQAGKLWKD